MVFLNSAQAALDLLDSRSSVYSDRPVMWMAGELAARKLSVFRTQFTDPRFKVLRRLLQGGLNPRAARSYRPIQMEETQVLLNALVDSPQDFAAHIRRYDFVAKHCSVMTGIVLLKEFCAGMRLL